MNKNKLFGILGGILVLVVIGLIVKQGGQKTAMPETTVTGKEYALTEVSTHKSPSDCWSTINGGVYNLTSWISEHPGGAQAIISLCGIDGTVAFNEQHGGQGDPERELASLKIGTLATSVPSNGKKMAFSEFIKQGGSYKCEVKQAFSDMENSGTTYISGGDIRGEYTTIAEGRTIKTSFILKDGYSYTWGDMMQGAGFKMKVNTDANANTGAAASGTYSWNAGQIGDYNCEPWAADQSKFALPSGVTFRDMSSFQPQ